MMDIKKLSLRKLILLGVGIVLCVWVFDSVVDYNRNPAISFWRNLISTGYDDFLVRFIVVIFTGGLVFILNKHIKNRVEHEDELNKHLAEIKRVAYLVIHDLKSPAIASFGLLKKLNERYGDALDAKGQELYRIIIKSSEEILELIEELNTYIKTKENPINVQLVSIKDLVQIIKEQVAIELRKKNIKWRVPEKDMHFRSDPFLLQRAIKNLVINSLKHGGENLSEIVIDFKKDDRFYLITVSDDGRGIKTDNPEALFDPFERLDESLEIDGIGLGLALVKEAAFKHGGNVWFKPRENSGVTFYFSIDRYI